MTMITYANPLDFLTISRIARERSLPSWSALKFLLGLSAEIGAGDFKTLRLMVAGADKCPDALREGYMKKHGLHFSRLRGNGNITSDFSELGKIQQARKYRKGLSRSGGKDRKYETGADCRTGEVGLIMVKGDTVMKGLL
jgi:acyl-[acyl-carrier-protein]-phospholipid O-acyltransferase/long-chain-fatty-acid--[acyl-carrier-protein] ligase